MELGGLSRLLTLTHNPLNRYANQFDLNEVDIGFDRLPFVTVMYRDSTSHHVERILIFLFVIQAAVTLK
jgi:heme/copper-type cytochrome/quinol oxidase subunit 4